MRKTGLKANSELFPDDTDRSGWLVSLARASELAWPGVAAVISPRVNFHGIFNSFYETL